MAYIRSLFALATCLQATNAAKLLAAHYTGTLYTLDLSSNNTLAIAHTTPSGASMPSWLAFDPASRTVYVTDESWSGSGMLASFKVSDDGVLTPAGSTRTKGGDINCGLYKGDGGKGFLAVANYDGSYISTYTLPLSSTSQPLQTLTFTMAAPGPNPTRQNKPHPHAIFASPSGSALVAPDLGADLLRVFAVDAATGLLRECPAARTAPGDGPRHGEFARFGGVDVLYTVNELGNSVSVWSVDEGADGCLLLTHLQTLSSYPPNSAAPAGSKAAEVHVFNTTVLISNRNDRTFSATHDSLATYSADAQTGLLRFVELVDSHAFFPRTFAISEDGGAVAVGGQTSADVAVLEMGERTGRVGGLRARVDVGGDGTVGGEDGLSAVIWI